MTAREFRYVDTAIDGANRRNRVIGLEAFKAPPGAKDCYATFLRFPGDLIAYMQAHRNKNGKPSVSGYPGPALAVFLPFDFDSEEDPARALVDTRRVVQQWIARYDVPAKAIRVWFSGCKGFSIELPATLFGGFEPSEVVADRLKCLAVQLAPEAATLDLTIYDKVRLWRVPNTINAKSGLYKVPLTIEELLDLDIVAIKALAASPRHLDVPGDDEWMVNPDLQALWIATSDAKSTRPAKVGVQGDGDTQKILDGKRNTRLTSLAGTMRRRGMGETAIAAALLETNATQCEPPLDEAEVRRIAASVGRYEPGDAGHNETENQTDLGNARRLVKHDGQDLRYVRAWGKWVYWDGTRWGKDETGEVERRAKETVINIYKEAAAAPDEGARKALSRHAMGSEAAHKIAAMIKLAESEAEVAIRAEQLDADAWLLNVLNGTLDLKTGKLREHCRDDLITKLAPVAYDPTARCPTFDAFLDRIFAGSRDLIAFVQRAVGYSLTGDVRERVIFILHGIGANGKTTLLEVLRAVLGDYALRTPTETLLVKRDGAIPNDVARLKGARFVAASESEEGRRLGEAFIKDVTGGDVISARFMRAEFFDFKPECKLWLATNHKPVIRGTDNAIWDRIRLIPFEVVIPEPERDKELLAKLRNELPGILRWLVEGCLAWQRDGLGMPSAVREATKDYRSEMDVLGRFIEECCVRESTATVKSSALYEGYKKWCEENREYALKQKAFSMRVAERGFEKKHHETGWWWYGIRLDVALTYCSDAPDGSDGSTSMNRLNAPREGSSEGTRQDPSVPSAGVVGVQRPRCRDLSDPHLTTTTKVDEGEEDDDQRRDTGCTEPRPNSADTATPELFADGFWGPGFSRHQ